MAISTGDAVYKRGSQVTVTTATSTLVDGAVDSESKTAISAATDDVPLVDLALKFQVATSPTVQSYIHVYRRDLNIDGTNDAPAPTLNNLSVYVGSFDIPASLTINTDYYVSLSDVLMSGDCELYIQNDTGVTINSGWTLKATQKTYGSKA